MKRSHGAHPPSAIKPNAAVNPKPNSQAAVKPSRPEPGRLPLDPVNSRVPGRQADDGFDGDCMDDCPDDVDVPFFN